MQALATAKNEEDFQAVGLLCREGIISLAQAVYDPLLHPSIDAVQPSETDAKRMLESYIWLLLQQSLDSEYNKVQLETVIVLSEIRKAQSQRMLIAALADAQRHEEIRAGAAWALGEFQSDEAGRTLVSVFDETSQEVKTEAARALLKIAPGQVPQLLDLMKGSSAVLRDGLAWVLARQGQFDPQELLEDKSDDDLRRWVGYILGYGKDRFLVSALEDVFSSDPEVYFSASVLWQLLTSWIRDLKEYG